MSEPINPDAIPETLAALRAWQQWKRGETYWGAEQQLQGAMERLFQPAPAPAAESCPKCGHDAIGMVYHRDHYACGYDYRRGHGQGQSAEQPSEHLHRHCQRCHYEWTQRCLTP